MIISNEVNVLAKYFINPISPEGTDYFPSIEGFISCRQATLERSLGTHAPVVSDFQSDTIYYQDF